MTILISFSLGISLHDLLDKPPDSEDLFDVIKDMSSSSCDIGCQLNVHMEDVDKSLCEDAKLKKILLESIQNETKEVK